MESDNTGAWIGFALVAVIIVVGLFYFFSGGEQEQPVETMEPQVEQTAEEPETPEPSAEEPTPSETTEQPTELPDEVKSYINLAREDYVAPAGRKKYEHEYTRRRLDALGTAIQEMGETVDGQGNRLDRVRNQLQQFGVEIQRDWTARHSDDVREAFFETHDAFNYLKRRSGQAQLDLSNLRSYADSIDPNELYLQQKSKAVAFFKETADVFESFRDGMN